jgi:hypothetical protein
MWRFCLNSLLRSYGRGFLRHIGGPHPARAAAGLQAGASLDLSGDPPYIMPTGRSREEPLPLGPETVIGLGYCLKPLEPPCPSGRPNHDCRLLEQGIDPSRLPEDSPCRDCLIGAIGFRALHRGCAVYVMTSAADILDDVFRPALEEGRYMAGLFALCPYSIRPFSVPLAAIGLQAWLFPYDRGDCADYPTWLQADRGIKREQTGLRPGDLRTILDLLRADGTAAPTEHTIGTGREGHVYMSAPQSQG